MQLIILGATVNAISSEDERTLAFADVALGQIRSLRQSAIPRNYEIWYVYATGYNSALNSVLNETLQRNGRLSETDLELIYDTYLSRVRTTDRIDKIGARVISEIEAVMQLIKDALGISVLFNESLVSATSTLQALSKDERIMAVVEQLLASTREAVASNRALEERLNSSKFEIGNLQDSLEAIRAESLTDPLTGLSNRKHFDQALAASIEEAQQSETQLCLLMLDIDYFKTFNDNFGHLTGDQILRLVGLTLRQMIKGQDITARFGGEEFAVVLPNTALRHALTVADNIRRAIMAKELKKKSTGEILGRVTISIGVATLKETDDPDALIGRADACLYAAKRNGRNRVISEIDPEYVTQVQVQVA